MAASTDPMEAYPGPFSVGEFSVAGKSSGWSTFESFTNCQTVMPTEPLIDAKFLRQASRSKRRRALGRSGFCAPGMRPRGTPGFPPAGGSAAGVGPEGAGREDRRKVRRLFGARSRPPFGSSGPLPTPRSQQGPLGWPAAPGSAPHTMQHAWRLREILTPGSGPSTVLAPPAGARCSFRRHGAAARVLSLLVGYRAASVKQKQIPKIKGNRFPRDTAS